MNSHFKSIIGLITHNLTISLPFALLLEIVSSLQNVYIPLEEIIKSQITKNTFLTGLGQCISSPFGRLNIFGPDDSLLQLIWISFACYFAFHLCVLGAISLISTKLNHRNTLKALSLAYLIHSRIIFFIAQYFLMKVVTLYKSCDTSTNGLFQCQPTWLAFTLLFSGINIGLSLFKEFMLYEIVPTKKSYYAVNTNLYHKIILLHKTLVVTVYFLLQDSYVSEKINPIINICFACLELLILFVKLPFYNLVVLKVSIAANATSLSTAVISVLLSFGIENSILGALWITLTPFLVKIFLIVLNKLTDIVLKGEFTSPVKAIYFATTLKHHKFGYQASSLYDTQTSMGALISNGTFIQQNYNIELTGDSKTKKEYEEKYYTFLAQKLSLVLNLHPKSRLLLLFLAQIYMKKLCNIPKAIMLIRRVESLSLTIPILNSVTSFNFKLMRIQQKEYRDQTNVKLNLVDYFQERMMAETIKKTIQHEVNTHLQFWEMINSEKIDIQTISDIASDIEATSIQVHSGWKNQLGGKTKHILNPLVLYGSYLDIVQEDIEEAKNLFKRFASLSSEPKQDQVLDVYSDRVAVVLVSIEKSNVGEIIDASGSAQTLFDLDKNKIIGNSLSVLLPPVFGEVVLRFLNEYSRKPTENLDYSMKSYSKSANGDFFEVEIQIKLYPEVSRQVKAMIVFEKLSVPKPMVLVNTDGTVLECSESLKKTIWSSKCGEKAPKSLMKVVPEFMKVNNAFNEVYGLGNDGIGSSTVLGETSRGQSFYGQRFQSNKNLMANLNLSKTLPICNSEMGGLIKKRNHRNSMSPENVPQDEAQRICNQFEQGGRLKFKVKHFETVYEMEYNVQIYPFQCNGESYKILFFNNNQEDNNMVTQSFNEKTESSSNDSSEFAAQFPEIEELQCGEKDQKAITHVNNLTSNATGVKRSEADIGHNILKKRQTIYSVAIPRQNQESSHGIISPKAKWQYHHESSISTTSNSSKKYAYLKGLRNIFSQSESFPLSRRISLFIFMVMLMMVVLAATSFLVSQQAIVKVDTGVQIIDLASLRLSQATRGWQLATRFFLLHKKIRFADVGFLKDSIFTTGSEMLKQNREMVQKLSFDANEDFIREILNEQISLWDPSNNKSSNYEKVDTFAATNLIAVKMLMIGTTAEDFENPNIMNDIQYIANNTGNDYYIYSEQLIVTTQSMLQKIIAANISNLQVILDLQIATLIVTFLSLLLAVRIIVQSYKVLFKALAKINEKFVSNRIQDLERIKLLLEEDLDSRNFGQKIPDILKPKAKNTLKEKAKSFKKLGIQGTERNISRLSMLKKIFKPIGLSLLVGQSITILSVYSLLGSISNFSFLEKANNQLSITAQAEYQTSAIISTFYAEMVWRNDTSMLVRNELPRDQLKKSLQVMQNINEDLIAVFVDRISGEFDPLIEELLESSVCKYLSNDVQAYCENATSNGDLGLLGINSKLFQVAEFYTSMYLNDPTYDNAKSFVDSYAEVMRPSAETLESSYRFMNGYILDSVETKISEFNMKTRLVHVGILIAVLISTIVIYQLSIKKLKESDMCRGKILKTISYKILLEDKVMRFYLNRHFSGVDHALSKVI